MNWSSSSIWWHLPSGSKWCYSLGYHLLSSFQISADTETKTLDAQIYVGFRWWLYHDSSVGCLSNDCPTDIVIDVDADADVFGSNVPPPIFCCFVVFREKRKKKKIVTTTTCSGNDTDADVDVDNSSSFAIFPLGYILFSATAIDQSNLCCPSLTLPPSLSLTHTHTHAFSLSLSFSFSRSLLFSSKNFFRPKHVWIYFRFRLRLRLPPFCSFSFELSFFARGQFSWRRPTPPTPTPTSTPTSTSPPLSRNQQRPRNLSLVFSHSKVEEKKSSLK